MHQRRAHIAAGPPPDHRRRRAADGAEAPGERLHLCPGQRQGLEIVGVDLRARDGGEDLLQPGDHPLLAEGRGVGKYVAAVAWAIAAIVANEPPAAVSGAAVLVLVVVFVSTVRRLATSADRVRAAFG